jgi:translation initiation factor 1A
VKISLDLDKDIPTKQQVIQQGNNNNTINTKKKQSTLESPNVITKGVPDLSLLSTNRTDNNYINITNENHKPNNNQQQEYRRVRTPKKGEIPGVVEQIMGHGKLKVRCADGNIRMTRIPGKMKKRIWIREGDVILVKPWDFQSDEKADVIWRYTKTESNWLERKGYLKM